MPVSKKWWQSKTIWFNVGTVLAVIGTEYGLLVDLFKPEYQDIIRLSLALVSAAGNAILRVVTSKPLDL